MVVESMLKSVLTAYDGLVVKSSFTSPCSCPGGVASETKALSPVSSECNVVAGDPHYCPDGGLATKTTDAATGTVDAGAEEYSTGNTGHLHLNHPESREHHPIVENPRQAEEYDQQEQERDAHSTSPTASKDGYGLVPELDFGAAPHDNKNKVISSHSRPPIAKPWPRGKNKKNRSTSAAATTTNHSSASSNGSQDSLSTGIQGDNLVFVSDDNDLAIGGGAVAALDNNNERSDDYFSSCTLSGSDAASDDDQCNESSSRTLPSPLPSALPGCAIATTTASATSYATGTSGGDGNGATLATRPKVCPLSPPRTPQVTNKPHLSLDQPERVILIHDTPGGGGGPFSPAHSSCTNPSYISSSSSSDGVLSDDMLLEGDDIFSHDSPAFNRLAGINSGIVVANEEYNIDAEDSREWLKLDSLSGDSRPMTVIHTTVSASSHGDSDQIISANTRRIVQRLSSSSLSMASREDIGRGIVSPRSPNGGLATLDTILMASSSLSVDTDIDLILEDNYNKDKGSIASTSIASSKRNSNPEMSASLRAALEELGLDEQDSFDYTSTENKEINNQGPTATTDDNNPAPETNEIQGTDSKRCDDDEDELVSNARGRSVSLVEDASSRNGKNNEESHKSAVPEISGEVPEEALRVSPDEMSPELMETVLTNQPPSDLQQDVPSLVAHVDVHAHSTESSTLMLGTTRAMKTVESNKVRESSLSDLSASMPPLDSIVSFTMNVTQGLGNSQDIIQARKQKLKQETCLAIKELEEEYQERVDEMKQQHEIKLRRLKRQLDLDLQRRAEYLRFDKASRGRVTPPTNCLKVSCGGTAIKEMVTDGTNVSNTIDNTTSTSHHQRKHSNHRMDDKGDPSVSETKKKKEAMEERLHSLLSRLHSPRGQNTAGVLCEDMSGTDASPSDGENESILLSQASSAIADELGEERTLLQHDLNKETADYMNRLQQNYDELGKEYALTVEEVAALKKILQSQQDQFNEDFSHSGGDCKERIRVLKLKLQRVKDENMTRSSDLCNEIDSKENSVSMLSSELEEMRTCNLSLEEKLELQEMELSSLKDESNAFQAHVGVVTETAENMKKKRDDELQDEIDKLGVACNQVREEVSAAIDRQYSEGNRKKLALEHEQIKVTERLGALKKLLLIKEAGNTASIEEWTAREIDLATKSKRLGEAIIFTEEKRTNKTAAFSRVVAQLNSSYDELSATIEETRQDTECIMKQRRDVTTDISNLVADNKQVEDWVKELMTVIDTLEKGGRRE